MRRHPWSTAMMAMFVLACDACDTSEARPRPDAQRPVGESSTTDETTTHTAWDTASTMGEAESSIADAGAVERYSAAQLDRLASDLARGAMTARTICAHDTYHCVEARRRSSGEPEIHDQWVDITVVQAGHATLRTSGAIANDRLVSPGEHRGGTMRGGSSRSIATGDLIVIPAGTSHQYVLSAGDSVRYLTIKVAQR